MGILKSFLRWWRWWVLAGLLVLTVPPGAHAGPYAPAADDSGSTAISMTDSRIVAWATGFQDYQPGADIDAAWKTPDKALGPAVGDSFDIVSLGRGGRITLTFDTIVSNGPGDDFAVFENSYSDTFLELAFVEVSSDGTNYFRFPNDSQTAIPVGGYGGIDPTNVDGFAGKYRQGFGTPFDLSALAGVSPLLDIGAVTTIRLVDVVGNGSESDSQGDAIYDPYPTSGSAGFDLDAVGLLHLPCVNVNAPRQPALLSPAHGATDMSLTPVLKTDAFADDDHAGCEYHMQTRWQVATDAAFSAGSLVMDATSTRHLTAFTVPGALLSPGTTYHWRARHLDSGATPSAWSTDFRFTTAAANTDQRPANGIPDTQEAGDSTARRLLPARAVDAWFKVLESVTGEGPLAAQLAGGDPSEAIERIQSVDPATLPDTPTGTRPETFLMGAVDFRIRVKTVGGTAVVTLFFSKSISSRYGWYKYHPATGWRQLGTSEARFGADGRSVTLTLTDGGALDADGIANGVIVDPGALGASGSTFVPQGDPAGIGGGCFIQTASGGGEIPARGIWWMTGAVGFGLTGAVITGRRRRRGHPGGGAMTNASTQEGSDD